MRVVSDMGNAMNKCQILQVGSRNIKNDYEMCDIKIKSVHSVKDLGVTAASNLMFSQQCNESVKKANRVKGMMRKNSRIKMLYYPCTIALSDLIWSMPCSFGLSTMQKTLLNKLFSAEQRR